VQRSILDTLKQHPEHRVPRSELRQLFPETDPAILRRAIRSLVRMGCVYEHAEDDAIDPVTDEWGVRWVVLVRYEPLPTKSLTRCSDNLRRSSTSSSRGFGSNTGEADRQQAGPRVVPPSKHRRKRPGEVGQNLDESSTRLRVYSISDLLDQDKSRAKVR
jgi:hypothetical protein